MKDLQGKWALTTGASSAYATVTVLSPGITATGFLAASGQQGTLYQRMVMMLSRPVVRIGLAALRAGRASVVPRLDECNHRLVEPPDAEVHAAKSRLPIDEELTWKPRNPLHH